jgi:hypothetical protein
MMSPLRALDFFHDGFEAFFKLASEAGPGDHRAQVERHHRLPLKISGTSLFGDFLCEAFHNGGLADARFTDQHRVVLGAARQDLDQAQNFVIAPNDGVELAFARQLGEVA